MKLKVEAILDKGFTPMMLVYREFTEAAKKAALVLLQKRVGVALGADKAERHRLVPKNTNAAPGCGHDVRAFFIANGDQRPILIK